MTIHYNVSRKPIKHIMRNRKYGQAQTLCCCRIESDKTGDRERQYGNREEEKEY